MTRQALLIKTGDDRIFLPLDRIVFLRYHSQQIGPDRQKFINLFTRDGGKIMDIPEEENSSLLLNLLDGLHGTDQCFMWEREDNLYVIPLSYVERFSYKRPHRKTIRGEGEPYTKESGFSISTSGDSSLPIIPDVSVYLMGTTGTLTICGDNAEAFIKAMSAFYSSPRTIEKTLSEDCREVRVYEDSDY